MKKIILLTVLLLMLSGCSKNDLATKTESDPVTPSLPAASEKVITPVTVDPEPSEGIGVEPAPTENPQYPILDEKITEALTTMMYEDFGGSGDEQYATSWYKYIDYWEIYQYDGFYSGVLYLNERPYDCSARILLSQYYSGKELDTLCPILMDAGASLDLDDIDLCLVGENLYKISTFDDATIYYYSLGSLDIPIYDFLAIGSGLSVADVKNAIKENQIQGDEAYQCILDYMQYTYSGSFDGLSMEKVKTMAMAALANFDDVRIETMDVIDQDGNLLNTYEKLN